MMTKQQLKAIKALRDVMREFDIVCEGGNVDGNIELFIGNDIVGGYYYELYYLDTDTITKIIQENE